MGDLKSRFEKETGKKAYIVVDVNNGEFDVTTINPEYVLWLERLLDE